MDDEPVADGRDARRLNLYLAATLISPDATLAVKVRNLSASGAMVESPDCPARDVPVTLRRSGLAAEARVVWRNATRCGLRFRDPVDAEAWVASSAATAGQQRVDRIVSRLRTGPVAPCPETPPLPPPDVLTNRLAEELAYVSRLLQQLGDLLADDPAIITRHPVHLQSLDLAARMIGHVGSVMTAENAAAVIAQIGMEDLRARLLRRTFDG